MKRSQILPLVEKLIHDRPVVIRLRYHLCFWEGHLQFLSSGHTDLPHTAFGCWHSTALDRGFSCQEWDQLENTIFVFLQSKGLL